MVDIKFQIKQFTEFYDLLMSNAPEGYKPWLFPVKTNGKDPDPQAIIKIDPSSKGSWHHPSAQLSKEQCIERLKAGGNIGISAREGDALIIGDIDSLKYLNQSPKTLTTTSRKRDGVHFFGWNKDGTAKINQPTDFGEMRSKNQYVVACGSYVPLDEKALNNLSASAKEDEYLGYYTLRENVQPQPLTFADLPEFFKKKKAVDDVSDSEVLQREEKKSYVNKGGKYSELLKLKMSDIVNDAGSNKRTGHPLHESTTDANFSLSKDGNLCHCWRHMVSLNPVQYLCVQAGYSDCLSAGTPHNSKNEGFEGRKFSKLKGDKKSLEVAYKEAVKGGLIDEYVKEKKEKETTSKIIDEKNKIIVEQVWDEENGSRFCIYDHNKKSISYANSYLYRKIKYFPHEGEEIKKHAILLPSEAIEYIDDKILDEEILTFANKWLDAPEEIMRFGLWNIKVSFVFEKFQTLNYLRVLGDTGTGKTRFLDVWGNLHYKPIFTSGATTAAPLFRIIEKWRGTLVMDEADLRNSDESEQVIKILNQGFEKEKFIMRCEQFNAENISFFDPFCPKILSTRKSFTDKATESRCITYVSSMTERKDILLNINNQFRNDSLVLRNKLLMWRFRNYFEIDNNIVFDLGNIEPRVKQIVGSYVALFSKNKEQMENFKKYIQKYQEDLIEERRDSFDGHIVVTIHKMLEKGIVDFDASDIINEGNITNKQGTLIKPRGLSSSLKSLGFGKSIQKRVGDKNKRCIPINEKHISKLRRRYGIIL